MPLQVGQKKRPNWPIVTPAPATGATGFLARRNFAGVIWAAFTVDDPVEALHIGLEDIRGLYCLLAQEVRWALNEVPNIHNHTDKADYAEELKPVPSVKMKHKSHTIKTRLAHRLGIDHWWQRCHQNHRRDSGDGLSTTMARPQPSAVSPAPSLARKAFPPIGLKKL